MGEADEGDEVFAFCLTLGAGLATTIGATMAFCVNQENNLIFASCLAVAAGVMTYVSFVEIFFKARDEYAVHGYSDADSNLAAVLTFFFGLLASILMEHVTSYFFVRSSSRCPIQELAPVGLPGVTEADIKDVNLQEQGMSENVQAEGEQQKDQSAAQETGDVEKAAERTNMLQMAAFSGIAIAAHNLPEGLATFIAAVEDPAFGVSMAIAIAIHNIPEGLAVAIPILKATNSKWRAFLWAFLSGVAEPIGAALAWLALREVISPLTYAMVFGVIGGVMVHISIRKLLPTALKYDPENRVSSYAFFAGMAIMASSLVFFEY
jgi:ZIP family zinc transporter